MESVSGQQLMVTREEHRLATNLRKERMAKVNRHCNNLRALFPSDKRQGGKKLLLKARSSVMVWIRKACRSHLHYHVCPNDHANVLPCLRLGPSDVGGKQLLSSHPKTMGGPIRKAGILVISFLDSSVWRDVGFLPPGHPVWDRYK